MSAPATLPLAGIVPVFFESARGLELIGFIFYIWMIYECWRREPNTPDKIMWLLLVALVPGIGSLIYFLLRVVKVRG